jgi:hypothetical protein
LVPGGDTMDFPGAEGEHVDQESDTWFIAGELTGATGRTFAFLTIFNKNRPGGTVVADFYTMSLFDCDTGEYGTFTDYDMPPKNMAPGAEPKMTMASGYLDIRYRSGAGPVVWTTCRDGHGELLPYTYAVSLRGTDQSGQSMALELAVTPTRAPVPVGADTCHGKITCFGQDDTYSYFQTAMAMSGTLSWGDITDTVSGTRGHVDRQWFPRYAGGGGTGGDPRARSHEWRTINLDNGVDMSIWRQFDRSNGNAPQPFTGATVSYPDPSTAAECAQDIEVTTLSYVRWPNEIRPLLKPLASALFMTSSASRWSLLRRMAFRSSTWKARIAITARCGASRCAGLRSTSVRWPSTGTGSWSRCWRPPSATWTQPTRARSSAPSRCIGWLLQATDQMRESFSRTANLNCPPVVATSQGR